MNTLSTVLRYELLFMLTTFILVIAYRLLTGGINTDGLLRDKASGRAVSAGRLQMLVITLGIAIYYVMMVIRGKASGSLPNLPNEFLMALAGSHGIYLSGKLYGMLASKLNLAATKIVEGTKTN